MSFGYDFDDKPENFGFELVDSLDDGGGYDWDIMKVWKNTATGQMYFHRDSGCSCNSFLDDVDSPADLTELTEATWAEMEAAAKEVYGVDEPARGAFIANVRRAFMKKPTTPRGKDWLR